MRNHCSKKKELPKRIKTSGKHGTVISLALNL